MMVPDKSYQMCCDHEKYNAIMNGKGVKQKVRPFPNISHLISIDTKPLAPWPYITDEL